ncbi:MAG: hypothetical protein ACFFEJ_03380 [Candidatus Thorarchaeota archaeon]
MSEAWSHDLPPIGFTINRTGTAMNVRRFPEPECYLKLSRPPQGALEFSVYSFKGSSLDYENLDHHLMKRFENGYARQVVLGKRIYIELAGVSRLARIFRIGSGLSQKVCFSCLIPSPDGGPYGLMLVYGRYSRTQKLPSAIHRIIDTDLHTLLESFIVYGAR